MSAFAVIYEPSGIPVDPTILERVMARLNHRGPDGHDTLIDNHIAMGHWHFWTTPEEVGEKQPLQIKGLPFTIVFDGRIDNRKELFTALKISPEESKEISDATLVLRAYQHWGEKCVEHFVGEFALAIFDKEKKELFCARDHLGDRTLFYTYQGSQIIIASEPWAITGASDKKPIINESAVAHYFAFKIPEDGQAFFNGIYELLPAHAMLFNATQKKKWHYWQPDLTKKIRYKSDEEYAQHFLSLLEESVHARMRSPKPVGVFLSGGLDSTSVAALAARMMVPKQLTTISYVFDKFPDCDERTFINLLKEKWKLQSKQLLCDDAWPFQNLDKPPSNLSQIGGNFYHILIDRLYKKARYEKVSVILTGGFGDQLLATHSNWFLDLVLDGRINNAINEIILHLKAKKVFNLRIIYYIIKQITKLLSGKHWTTHHEKAPAWLTPLSIARQSRR